MFCYQCQETAKNIGCKKVGVCGKSAETSNLQDMTIWLLKGLSQITSKLRSQGYAIDKEVNHLITESLFMTITNANFDSFNFYKRINVIIDTKENLLEKLKNRDKLSEAALWSSKNIEEINAIAEKVGVLSCENEDIRSLRELTIYGLKGLAAYLKHANVLLEDDEEIDIFIQEALVKTMDDSLNISQLTELVLETGANGVKGMALLDKANTQAYGNPEISEVNIGVRNNPGILISGHDLRDMEILLNKLKKKG